MRFNVHCVLVGAILLCSSGCVQKSAKLQKSVVPPDKTLFDTGSDYLRKGQYIKSRLAFQTLLNTYPDSEMAEEAYFALGDSFYEEGGTENLLQAEDQYKNFIVFYPGSAKADDAQLKTISLNYKLIGTPDRDQQYARKSLQEIAIFEKRYPSSDFFPIVKQLKNLVEDNLAKGDYGIGKFYEERGNLSGAQGRYQEIVDQFKNYAGMDSVLFSLGEIYGKSNDPKLLEQAAGYFESITKGFPFSKHYEESKSRLISLGKEIPPVDTVVAAANQSRVKPNVGFSPFKPLVDFGKALGFVAPPDQYEVAQKSIEAEKAKNAELAAAQTSTNGQEAGGDIQIATEIRKSISGDAKSATSAGSGSGNSAQGGAEKKDSGRYKKKTTKKTR
jgi:outer membrane assembly lipoprotein YfiO